MSNFYQSKPPNFLTISATPAGATVRPRSWRVIIGGNDSDRLDNPGLDF